MAGAARLVFSRPAYALMASAIFSAMALGLLAASGYVFLEPYVAGGLPPGSEAGLALILALCALSALVIPMNVFRMRAARGSGRRAGGGVAGSVLGSASGACGCGPVGFAMVSTFGGAGAAASAFLSNHEIPIRAAAVAVLLLAYYATARSLRAECGAGR